MKKIGKGSWDHEGNTSSFGKSAEILNDISWVVYYLVASLAIGSLL